MQAVIGTLNGESHQLELDDQQAQSFIGKQIGDEVDGSVIGLSGYTLEVTGGSDREGFPMRESIQGTGRRRILVGNEAGGADLEDGERRRKSVRGNTVSQEIEQLNLSVVEAGDDSVESLLFGENEEDEETAEADEDAEESEE